MAIPEQVRRQSEAVAELYKDLNPDPNANPAPVEGDEPVSDDQTDGEAARAAEPTPTEHGRTGTKDDELTYEQRWRSLQGMYNADTTRLRSENNQLNQRVSQLEQLISSLGAPQQAQTPAQAAAAKLITDQDVEDYGDSIDIMRKAAREELASRDRELADLKQMVLQMQTNVVPKVDSVVQRQALTAENQFWSELSAEVPDWREVNADQNFQSWLLEVDPLSGNNRQVYLDAAQGQLDSRRVAGFFKTWQSMNSGSVAQQTRNAAATQLERQIAPGRGRSSTSATTGSNDKTYSRADVAAFFDDVRKGVYRGKEQERDRIERDIFAAQRDGRIT